MFKLFALTPDATRWLAVGVLVAFVASFAWAAWCDARRTGFRPAQYPLYWFYLVLTRVLWRAKIIGRLQLPAGQGAVIVCNHRSPIDPVFVGLACKLPVHWMVAHEYFAVPVFGAALRILGAIPTRRGGVDTAAVKQTIRFARQGEPVGILPEGRINITDHLMLPLRNGAVAVALAAKVPIVPCFIADAPHDKKTFYGFLFTPARTTLTVGSAIDLTPYYDRADDRTLLDELTLRVGRAMATLAGRPDYEPELATRRRRGTDRDETESPSA
jgi:1-acyl-sn-glycerol-3-phosphate acyltransferase